MSSFALVFFEGGGNSVPMLALGARLVRAGHRVRMAAPRRYDTAALARGIELTTLETVPNWPPGIDEENDPEGYMAALATMLMSGEVAKALAESLQSEPVDVAIVDCMMANALTAAEAAGIPTAVLIHVLWQPFVSAWGQAVLDLRPARKALGLPPLGPTTVSEVMARSALRLVTVPPGFDLPSEPGEIKIDYVGPILDPDFDKQHWQGPWPLDDRRPLVLVSLSTTPQWQQQAFPPMLAALSDLPVRGLVTIGHSMAPEDLDAPPNVTVVGHIPHNAVLDQVSVFVSHGGLSSVMTSLAWGVPLVCIPQGREQGDNAERAKATGAAKCLPREAAADEIAFAIHEVLDGGSFTRSARAAQADIAQLGHGEAAVTRVEALLNE